MAEQMIITLKQRLFELQQTYASIQKELELIATYSRGTDTGYNEMSDSVREVVDSLEQFYNSLNQENSRMYQDFNNHPESIKEVNIQLDEMAIAATELQQGNQELINSIIESGIEQKQTNSNQIKEGE